MSIVFVNDHPFYVDQADRVFTSGTLGSDVWSRFTENFGDLTVIGRGVKIGDKPHNHTYSNAPNVSFDLFYEIKGGKDYLKYKRQIINKLTPYIQTAEFIVLRLPSSIGVIAAKLCEKYNKKYFVEVVGCAYDSMWYFGNIQGKLLAGYTARKNRAAIYKASGVVYVTKKYLQERYPNLKSNINASNVVVESFEADVLTRHLKLISRGASTKKIGMIGNIALPYKGYSVLFKALSSLTFNYRLMIVGGGAPDWINKLIAKYNLEDKVVLMGRINNREEIYNFLDQLDLYVQPSLTEGLPRSVIEAMSRACPIIASDAGGIPELINKEFVYSVNDYGRLNELLATTLSDIDTLQKLSKENFLNAKEYSFESINERRYQYFNEIKEKIRN